MAIPSRPGSGDEQADRSVLRVARRRERRHDLDSGARRSGEEERERERERERRARHAHEYRGGRALPRSRAATSRTAIRAA